MSFSDPLFSLSRRARFSAGRRLFCPHWDDQRNRQVYGRDVLPHGHEYELEVAFRGPITAQDGMIVNLVDLKPILGEVIALLEDRWLEQEIPAFVAERPTAENLALFLWDALPATVGPARRYRLQLRESRTTQVEIAQSGVLPLTMKICRSYEFAAAHRLHVPELSDQENRERFDKCSNPAGHGHNYGLDVWIEGAADPESGFIINPIELDGLVDAEVYARFDHKHLNLDCPEFIESGLVPTSENLARLIFELLGARLAQRGHRLARIGLRETQKNYFEVEA